MLGQLFSKFARFRRDTSGAVTVDWVLLTSALVLLGVAVLTTVGGSMMTASDNAASCQERISNVIATSDADYIERLKEMDASCAGA